MSLAEFGMWFAETVAGVLVAEGMRHIIEMKHTSKFKKALKESTFKIAKEYRQKYPDESKKLHSHSKEVSKKLYKTLQSPAINKDSFVLILAEIGIGKEIAEKLFEEIEARFIKILEEEGLRDNQVFNGIVIDRTKKILEETRRVRMEESDIREEISSVFKESLAKLKELDQHIEVLDKKIEDVKRLVGPIPDIQEFLKRYMQFVSKSCGFGYELDEIFTRLLQAPLISAKISDVDRRKLAKVARDFQNFWIYLSHRSEMSHELLQDLSRLVEKVTVSLSETDDEIRLRLILSLFVLDLPEIRRLSCILEKKSDPEARRLVILATEALVLEELFKGQINEATNRLEKLETDFPEMLEVELAMLKLLVLLQKGFSEDNIRNIVNLLNGLRTSLDEENVAYVAGSIAQILLHLGQIVEAKQILESFGVSKYFPDVEIYMCALDCISRNEFEKAKWLLKKLTVSSKFRDTREFAQLSLITLESFENPFKALKNLDQLMADLRPHGELLARCFYLRSILFSKNGLEDEAGRMLDFALEVLDDFKWDFSASAYRAQILLAKAQLLVRPGGASEISKIIKIVEKMPLFARTKLELLRLKLFVALEGENPDLQLAESIIDDLQKISTDTHSRILSMPAIIELHLRNGEPDLAKKSLKELLASSDITWFQEAQIYYLSAWIDHRTGNMEEALKFYSMADRLIQEKGIAAYAMEYGYDNYDTLLLAIHGIKKSLAEKHLQRLDFDTALELTGSFPGFLKHFASGWKSKGREGASSKQAIDVGLGGCIMRVSILHKYGKTNEALAEIGQMLELDLPVAHRAHLLLLRSEFEMSYNLKAAELDVEEAMRIGGETSMRSRMVAQRIKLQYLACNFIDADSVEDEVEKLEENQRLHLFDTLGLFFAKERAYPLAILMFKEGLKLIAEKDSVYRRFSLNLAEAYSHSQPQKSLQILDELQGDFNEPHETTLIKEARLHVFLKMKKYEEFELLLKDFDAKELNEDELQEYYRTLYEFQVAVKRWEPALSSINSALRSAKALGQKNRLLLRKVRCAIELSNGLMAIDVLENMDLEALTEIEKEEFYVLNQKALVLSNREQEAIEVFSKALPKLHSKAASFLVQESIRCYHNEKLQLEVLRRGFEAARAEGLSTDDVIILSILTKEILNKVTVENVKNDLNLLFLFGTALESEQTETILVECLKQGFSPQYIVYYFLSLILGTIGKVDSMISYAEKAYGLNPQDPWIAQQFVGGLLARGDFEKAQSLLEKFKNNSVFQVSELVHNQRICLFIAKNDYISAKSELERWIKMFPGQKLAMSILSGIDFLSGEFEESSRLAKEILARDPNDSIAIIVDTYLKHSSKSAEQAEEDVKKTSKVIQEHLKSMYCRGIPPSGDSERREI